MSKPKIFIIEDDVNICSALTAKFSVAGFNAVSYVDAHISNILRKITLHRPDYIILDLTLPGLDGHELLSAIKADQELGRLPVFVFSDASAAARGRALDLGADHYFEKHETVLDELVAKVQKIIANKSKLAKMKKGYEIKI